MDVESEHKILIPDDVTLPEYLLQNCKRYGNRAALIDGVTNVTYTYSQLCTYITRCSNSLVDLGLSPGTKVCIVLPNCIQYPIIYLAVLHAGAVCVPLSSVSSKYELEFYIKDCEATFVVTTPSIARIVNEIQTRNPGSVKLQHVIIIGDMPGCISFDSLLVQHNRTKSDDKKFHFTYNSSPGNVSLRTVATISYSSGTAGLPKGCQQSHYSYIAQITQIQHICKNMSSNGGEVTVACLPMSHMFGQLVYLTHGLFSGTTQVILSTFQITTYLELIRKYQATMLHIVPPIMSQLLECSELQLESLQSVRYLFNSAAPLLESNVQEFNRLLPHIKITQGYGCTEFMFSFLSSAHDWMFSSSGKLLPNCKARVVDAETGRRLGPLKDGEICVKCPSFTNGYLKHQQNVKLYDADGFFKSGDIGHYDNEYNFFVVGRAKELIKYKGFQVSPSELESVILQHPGVRDVAVIGVPDKVAGDLPKAYVVCKPLQCVSERDISEFVSEHVAPYKKLRGGVAFIDEIPKSASGKILRKELQKIEQTNRHTETLASKL